MEIDVFTLFPEWFQWFTAQRHVCNALAAGVQPPQAMRSSARFQEDRNGVGLMAVYRTGLARAIPFASSVVIQRLISTFRLSERRATRIFDTRLINIHRPIALA